MTKENDTQKKDYSKIEAKDNMDVKTDNNGEEVDDSVEVREKPQQILDKAPKKRKKGLMERLVVGFLGPEGLPGIGRYLNEEIIVPSIKNIIVESVTSGINMAVFGDKGATGRSRNYAQPHDPNRRTYKPSTNYAKPTRTSRFTSAQPEPSSRTRQVRGVRYMVDDFPIDSRMKANEILVTLREFADRYDYVSVGEYYDMIGVESQHTDHNYGWSYDDIAEHGTVTTMRGGGYLVNLPPVTEI